MAVKNRNRTNKAEGKQWDDFVDQGGTAAQDTSSRTPEPAPAAPAKGEKAATPAPELPGWVQRAQSAKKTEAQPFRYNRSQQQLLERAKQVEGRDYSKILADIVWPALEEKYGADVPVESQ